jgi:hypothetical protein
MKTKATQPFNAYNIIAQNAGDEVEISDEVAYINLARMGYVEPVGDHRAEAKHEDSEKVKVTKKK